MFRFLSVALSALCVASQQPMPGDEWRGTVTMLVNSQCISKLAKVRIGGNNINKTAEVTIEGFEGTTKPATLTANKAGGCFAYGTTDVWFSQMIGPRPQGSPTAVGRPTTAALPPTSISAPTPLLAPSTTAIQPTAAPRPTGAPSTRSPTAPTNVPKPTVVPPALSGGVITWHIIQKSIGAVGLEAACSVLPVTSPTSCLLPKFVLRKVDPSQYMNQFDDVDGGRWKPCYSSNGGVDLEQLDRTMTTGVFGMPGYRRDCVHTQFSDVLYVNHDTNERAWFKRVSPGTTSIHQLRYNSNALSLFRGYGPGVASDYHFQLTVCGSNSGATAMTMSGFNSTCWKTCRDFCGDATTQYFRHGGTGAGGVAFRTNGLSTINDRPTVSLLVREPLDDDLVLSPLCQQAHDAILFKNLRVVPGLDCDTVGGLAAIDSNAVFNQEKLTTNGRIQRLCGSTCRIELTKRYTAAVSACTTHSDKKLLQSSYEFAKAARFSNIVCLNNITTDTTKPDYNKGLLYQDYQNPPTTSTISKLRNVLDATATALPATLDSVCMPHTRSIAERLSYGDSSFLIGPQSVGGLGAKCANEGGYCTCSGKVTFGALGRFTSVYSAKGGLLCGVGSFSFDPVVGVTKACFCLPSMSERDTQLFDMLCDKHPAHGGNYTISNFQTDLSNIFPAGSKYPRSELLCRPGYGRVISSLVSLQRDDKITQVKKFSHYHSLLCTTGDDGGPGRCQKYLNFNLVWLCDSNATSGACPAACKQSIKDMQAYAGDSCCWRGLLSYNTKLVGSELKAFDRWATSKCGTPSSYTSTCKGEVTTGVTLGKIDPLSLNGENLPLFTTGIAQDLATRLRVQDDEVNVLKYFIPSSGDAQGGLEVIYSVTPSEMELADATYMTTAAIKSKVPGMDTILPPLGLAGRTDLNPKNWDSVDSFPVLDNKMRLRSLAPTIAVAPTSTYDPNTGLTIPPTPMNGATPARSTTFSVATLLVVCAVLLF